MAGPGITSGQVKEIRQSGMERACESVSVARGRLLSLVESLEKKASPVLTPDYPSAPLIGQANPAPSVASAPGSVLDDVAQMNNIMDRFNQIIDRLDM